MRESRAGSGPDCPPWIFLWMVLFTATLPERTNQIRSSVGEAFALAEKQATYGSRWAPLLQAPSVLEMLPAAALAAGLLVVLIPGWRGRWVERKYGLKPLEQPPEALAQAQELVHRRLPRCSVRANLLRTNQLAFAYPTGYGHIAIGICGGLLRLWRRDRPAAEAVLEHEMAHHRRRDAYVVGVGSLLERTLRSWWLLILIFLVIPLAVVSLDVGLRSFRPASYLSALPLMLVNTCITTVLLTAVAFVAPITAIWCSELDADRLAGQHAAAGLQRALEADRADGSLALWLLRRISHPPTSLRLWMATRRGAPESLLVLLGLFPLAYVVRFGLLVVMAGHVMTSTGTPMADVSGALGGWTLTYFQAAQPTFVAIACTTIAWPWLSRLWDRSAPDDEVLGPRSRRWPYFAMAAAAFALVVLPHVHRGARTFNVPPPAQPPSVSVSIRPGGTNDSIVVHWAGLPGNEQDWINVVPADAPADTWGLWTYTAGQSAGQWEITALPPGRYEVRVYYDWPAGKYEIRSRDTFTVP